MQADARHIDKGQGVQTLEILGQRLAQSQVLRPVEAGQAGVCGLQGEYGDRHVTGQLELLAGQGDGLFNFEQGRFLAAACQVLVERLQGLALPLELAKLAFDGTELGLQGLKLLAQFLLRAAVFLVAGIGLSQTAADFLLRFLQLLAGFLPLLASQHKGGQGDEKPGILPG